MNCDQTRLTAARANQGLSAAVAQAANFSLREKGGFGGNLPGGVGSFASGGVAGSSRAAPARNFGLIGSPFLPGCCSFAGPVNNTSPTAFSPTRKRRLSLGPSSTT